MFNLKKSLIALIAVLTLYGVEARGESFVITDVEGRAYITTSKAGGPPTVSYGPMYFLWGPGLLVSSYEPSFNPGSVEARDACIIMACIPGQVIGTNSSFSGLLSMPNFTYATVNGVTYWNVRFTGWLNFVSSPIVVPDFTGIAHQVTIPFFFSGELTGEKQSAVVNPVFTAKLSGQGMATIMFDQLTATELNPKYRVWSIDYQFVEPFPILIDIKPATFPNSINPNSKGRIPVAILTTDSFDATSVDLATVWFGATGTEVAPVHSATEDVDGDGDLDVILHFVTLDTGITCGDVSASLRGALFNKSGIKGTDSIETVPCVTKKP